MEKTKSLQETDTVEARFKTVNSGREVALQVRASSTNTRRKNERMQEKTDEEERRQTESFAIFD